MTTNSRHSKCEFKLTCENNLIDFHLYFYYYYIFDEGTYNWKKNILRKNTKVYALLTHRKNFHSNSSTNFIINLIWNLLSSFIYLYKIIIFLGYSDLPSLYHLRDLPENFENILSKLFWNPYKNISWLIEKNYFLREKQNDFMNSWVISSVFQPI